MCHRKLLAKLEYYGVRDPLLKCFNSYLISSLQRVVLNGLYSNWNEVKSGIPKVSLLEPTLICFFLYVNDMPNFTIETTLAMFADDSKCYKCNESPDDFDTIQTDLNHLQRWSLANEMTFQPKKFENFGVSRKRTSPGRSSRSNVT